jgi:hypothetical protein
MPTKNELNILSEHRNIHISVEYSFKIYLNKLGSPQNWTPP